MAEPDALPVSADRQDALEAAVADWKDWHREVCAVLGLEVVERSVTLARVRDLVERAHDG